MLRTWILRDISDAFLFCKSVPLPAPDLDVDVRTSLFGPTAPVLHTEPVTASPTASVTASLPFHPMASPVSHLQVCYPIQSRWLLFGSAVLVDVSKRGFSWSLSLGFSQFMWDTPTCFNWGQKNESISPVLFLWMFHPFWMTERNMSACGKEDKRQLSWGLMSWKYKIALL